MIQTLSIVLIFGLVQVIVLSIVYFWFVKRYRKAKERTKQAQLQIKIQEAELNCKNVELSKILAASKEPALQMQVWATIFAVLEEAAKKYNDNPALNPSPIDEALVGLCHKYIILSNE